MPWSNGREARRRSDATYNRTIAVTGPSRWRCEIRIDGCQGAATQCDHIVPVSQGGTHDLSNLRGACASCHGKTTAQQGCGYRRNREGSDPDCRSRTAW